MDDYLLRLSMLLADEQEEDELQIPSSSVNVVTAAFNRPATSLSDAAVDFVCSLAGDVHCETAPPGRFEYTSFSSLRIAYSRRSCGTRVTYAFSASEVINRCVTTKSTSLRPSSVHMH
jgi:hypothetical protein